jgi:hypothetical protein
MSFTLQTARPVVSTEVRAPLVFKGGPRAFYTNPAAQDFGARILREYQIITGYYPLIPDTTEAVHKPISVSTKGLNNSVVPTLPSSGQHYIAKMNHQPMSCGISG